MTSPAVALPRTRSKFRNVPTEVDGVRFDSKREARRFGELQWLEKAGEVKNIARQATYPLVVNQIRIASYRADFTYEERAGSLRDGYFWRPVVEDVKGVQTPVYKIKRALMKAIHGIDIRET